MASMNGEQSVLEKLDSIGEPLKQFDAFPKIPNTYKARRGEGGLLTLFAILVSVVLILNDVAEYLWGWPDYEFSVDKSRHSYMPVNVDVVVNMPCQYLSVDIRDAVGDRLHLSEGLKRDSTVWDVGQATRMQNHSETLLSATQVIRESRKSRGLFSIFQRTPKPEFKPTYKHISTGKAVGNACRIYGSMFVKKVTANLHITTAGHGYSSHVHTDHTMMNLSHVISEFSFGPFIPDISQPLDNLFEVAREPFTAYQYFITVVPTSYQAPRSRYPLRTNQYSVTNYKRTFEHGRATPGIFFKFDIDPMQLTVIQRTTTFTQLLIRVIGVVGGVWVCMGFAVKVGYRAAEAVVGPSDEGFVVAESSAVQKKRWVGGELRARPSARSGPVGGSPYASYQSTPTTGAFPSTPGTAQYARVPLPPSAGFASPGFPQSTGFASPGFPRSNASVFPPSPLPGSAGFPTSPAPGATGFPSSPAPGAAFPRSPGPQGLGFPPHQVRASSGLRVSSTGEELGSPYTPPPPKKEKSD